MALEGIQGNTLGAYQYRPRAVLISTSGIFPVYLLKPWVNLYGSLASYDRACSVHARVLGMGALRSLECDKMIKCIYFFTTAASNFMQEDFTSFLMSMDPN